MADCEAPSFSLGLDLDHTLDEPAPRSPLSPSRASARLEDEVGFGPEVAESDPEMAPEPPPRILKRLRRGPSDGSSSSVQRQEGLQLGCDRDDDIEEFSDEEYLYERPSKLNKPLCSSSKVSLNGSGVLTTHSSGNYKERKIKEASGILGSATLKMGQSGLMFPKLTTSPLRRFQLLDSDSDSDDPVSEDVNGALKIDPFFKEPSCRPSEFIASDQSRKASFRRDQNQDLWKDFSPVKSFSIPTPALNEVCEEYFCSAKEKEAGTSVSASHYESLLESTSCQRDKQIWNSAYPPPPAHQYFFHKDSRIRQLVRSRLCNFHPLGVDKVNDQPNASHIDYMGQFSNGEASKKKEVRNGYTEKSSTKGRTKRKELTIEEPFHASGGWVTPKINSLGGGESSKRKATKKSNTKTISKGKSKANKPDSAEILHTSANWVKPKNCANMPKDAGRRRVQAKGQSVGHWFTASDGRKVYVTKDGQELTGQAAYRHYRRERGSGFKKSKKKTSGKKKTN
ncbi:hypothetical protein QN277_018547 [Acacia crassicarpa]|uniref:Uncharacterized protein n=1 Tax=Acacia crassicarpa TaxID=499986 RepID=A0AAE1MUT3_9FABA|nr:hypothetical protein QN277_018547 [Acacia crassicarpa]